MCNKNQLDALFVISLFRQSTSTVFDIFQTVHLNIFILILTNLYMFRVYL